MTDSEVAARYETVWHGDRRHWLTIDVPPAPPDWDVTPLPAGPVRFSPRARAVLAVLHGSATADEVARTLGLSVRGAQWGLRELVAAGVATVERVAGRGAPLCYTRKETTT